MRAIATSMQVSISTVHCMEQLTNEQVTLKYLQGYAQALRIPIGAIVDEECDLAIKRGALIQGYRQLLTLLELDLNPEQTIRATLIKNQLEAAMPDLLPRDHVSGYCKLDSYPRSDASHVKELGKIALHPIAQEWFSSYDIAEPLI